MTPDLLIIERLTRVEEKIDNFLMRMLDQHDVSADHEQRIRALESGRSRFLGIASVLVFIITVFGAAILSAVYP